ncbi:hypothetical protein [Burkholderia anthina]|uniref:hypothetical protein n=1 Tax=Burkholderia anthina TaxID=179879 RepID=UPI0037C162D1
MDSARSSSGLFLARDNLLGLHQGLSTQALMHAHLRIARPGVDLARTERMYCDAFELLVLMRFDDHDSFSGVMLGREGLDYHFEFTHCPA